MPPFNSTAFAAAANAAADLVLLSSSEPPPSSPPPSAPWTVCTDEQRTVWPFLCTANDKRLGLWRAPPPPPPAPPPSFMAKIRPAYRRHAVVKSSWIVGGDASPRPALQPLPTIPPEAVEGNGGFDNACRACCSPVHVARC